MSLLNDPKLTAFALGELSGPEAKEIEMQVNKSEKLQKEVEEIKKTALFFSEGLSQEKTPEIDSNISDLLQKEGEKKFSLRKWFKLPMIKFGLPVAFAVSFILINLKNMETPTTRLDNLTDGVFGKQDQKGSAPAYRKRQANSPSANYDMALKKESTSKVASGRIAPHRSKAKMKMAMKRNFQQKPMILAQEEVMPSARFIPSTPPTEFNTESYDFVKNNDFIKVLDSPLSTFSIDVDTASYSNMRRFIGNGTLPIKDSVRVEEFINYFSYNYKAPPTDRPFSTNLEVASSPWHRGYKLVRVGLKGKIFDSATRPSSNIVFLLDVSGSMSGHKKLPLLTEAIKSMIRKLGEKDTISIVVYAGASGLVLPPTKASNKLEIIKALNNLKAGGSTNGGAGIELAYKTARENFVEGGINRVILATDGDFNVGTTSRGSLVRLIQDKAKSNIFLSVLGLGMGNYKDSTLEELADKGNGNYAYLDTLNEAKKVLGDGLNGTLITIAKDVKIQVEFNPTKVQAYRLVGYANRKLEDRDFNDDTKDAGEIGAGHTVTAFYEIVPTNVKMDLPSVDKLKYQKTSKKVESSFTDELLTLKVRYKEPTGSKSKLLSVALKDSDTKFEKASDDFRFATAVASYAMILRDNPHIGDMTLKEVIDIGKSAKGADNFGHRIEFLELAGLAREIKQKSNK
ncbi:MAG: VWA domain-containing protein [Bacteriovoracaceae bacterium]|mgnify:CR=1 FL=1|jgi:Ca-activated chloride channel homolog|nr:VWA domain-containing protein [Bacteriovoracaceae bacterium]